MSTDDLPSHHRDGLTDESTADDQLVACETCGRRGLPERIAVHDCPKRAVAAPVPIRRVHEVER